MDVYKAVAQSYHAPSFVKFLSRSVSVSEEDLWEFLRSQGNVVVQERNKGKE